MLILSALLVLVFYGPSMFPMYATDSYAYINSGKGLWKEIAVNDGRLMNALMYFLWFHAGFSYDGFYAFSHVITLLTGFGATAVLAQTLLAESGRTETRWQIMAAMTSFTAVCSLFSVEYMMFNEKPMNMMAIFMAVMAFRHFRGFLRDKRVLWLIGALGCLLVGVFAYQGAIGVFLMLVSVLIYRYEVTDRMPEHGGKSAFLRWFLDHLYAGLLYAAAMLSNLVFMKVAGSGRAETDSAWLETLKDLPWDVIRTTTRTFQLMPHFVYALLLVLVFLLNVVGIAAVYGRARKAAVIPFLQLLWIFVVTVVVSMAPMLMGNGDLVPRVIYPYSGLIGYYGMHYMINVLTLRKTEDAGIPENKAASFAPYPAAARVFCGALAVLLLFQQAAFLRIYKDKYILNAMDEYRAKVVGAVVEQYEAEHGVTVDKLCIYRDASPAESQYPGLYDDVELLRSAYIRQWSQRNALNYYLGRDLQWGETDAALEAEFASKNWDLYSQDQVVVQGDTLHLCIY